MRRLALILAVLLLATPLAQATEFGLIGGVNMANMSGDLFEDYESMLAFGGGTYTRLSIVPQFTIHAEALYMMKGAKLDENDEKLKLNYLEFPVLLMFSPPMAGPMSPTVFAGPYFGYLLDATSDVDGEELDMSGAFKDIDFGVVFGAGVDIKMGQSGKVFLSGRYSKGLTNATDLPIDDVSAKNNVLSFFVGYSMGVGP